MPKRIGDIYPLIDCDSNIELAIRKAARGKKKKAGVIARFLNNTPAAVKYTHEQMNDGNYNHPPYIEDDIFDGANKKARHILKPPFAAQVVHWALMLQIEPIIMRGMYDWNCGSVPGRGQARCKQGVERWLRNDPEGTRYCLKLDITKFYPSINNEILKAQFRRVIKCKRTLALIDSIIDSAQGLPIGNYTSQWFANFYLQPADHFIKEKLRHAQRVKKDGEIIKTDVVKYYARFADDMVLFGPNKRKLHKARKQLFEYLTHELDLRIKDNWQLFLVTTTKVYKEGKRAGQEYKAGRDVDFLGFRMNHERTILRKRIALRMIRRARKIGQKEKPTLTDAAAMVSYDGFLMQCDSHSFKARNITPYVNINNMKEIISNATKQRGKIGNGGKPGSG